MVTDQQPLPHFDKPPVIETVLGVFFNPLEKLTSAEQGILWEHCFRNDFPKLRETSPIDDVSEQFESEEQGTTPKIRWKISNRPDTPRLWATSGNGEHVVQIQRNAFLTNWLKTPHSGTYRPYFQRRQEFEQQLEKLDQFLREKDMGRIEPISWMVTYVNHIEYEGLQNLSPTLAKLLTYWSNELSDNWLPPPDKVGLNLSFLIPGCSGRLNVSIIPMRLQDKKRQLRMDLTARGRINEPKQVSVLEGIDVGHEWVVRGFASLTRVEMHQIWEKQP